MFQKTNAQLLVTDLPDEILEKIMYNLTYDQIAKNRIVCEKFNSVCKNILNRECILLASYIENYMNEVKSTLPRRESTRTAHPRYKHFRVLERSSVYLKSLINVYSDYKENNLYCFIAGQVLDEAIRILNVLKGTETFSIPTSKITDEFCEIANMAEEHFKEFVRPSLKAIVNNTTACNFNALEKNSSEITENNDTVRPNSHVPACDSTVTKQNQTSRKFNYRIRRNKIAVSCVRNQIAKFRSRLHKQTRQLDDLANRLERGLEGVEQKLAINSTIELEKHVPLESYERSSSHVTNFRELNSAGLSDTKKLRKRNQQSLELKIDHATTLLTNVIGPLFFLSLFVQIICLTYCCQK